MPVTFGLGKPKENKSASLEIVWPSGKHETAKNIQPNQFITLQEGKGIVSQQPIAFAGPKAKSSPIR